MKHFAKRLEALEHGVPGAMQSPEEAELLRKCLLSHYGGEEVHYTAREEEMLEETLQWFRDEGLCYLLRTT
jgi:hypothetical protein